LVDEFVGLTLKFLGLGGEFLKRVGIPIIATVHDGLVYLLEIRDQAGDGLFVGFPELLATVAQFKVFGDGLLELRQGLRRFVRCAELDRGSIAEPSIDLVSQGDDSAAGLGARTANGHSEITLPALNGADTAADMLGDLLPGIKYENVGVRWRSHLSPRWNKRK
jgi:hypothetical protein